MATIPFKNVIFMMHNHLSLSTPTTHLSVSASPSSSSSVAVDYLTNSCGLPLESAISTSQKLQLNENNIHKFDSFITLFKSHGFDNAHISTIIQRQPKLLIHYQVDDILKPKLEFLVESGFSGPHLHELIVRNPRILKASLSHKIKPSLDFLSSFLGTEERLKLVVKRNPRLLTNNLNATLQPNIDILVKEGVPLDALTNFFTSYPNLMQSNVDKLVFALQIVKDLLNMPPTARFFILAVSRIASMGVPLWKKKLRLFESLGFSQQEALSIFKHKPECFCFSEEKIRSKLSFYFNTVGLKKEHIVTYPQLLTYGIEKRIGPRHNVLKLLWSKKLLKEDTKIAHLFIKSEKEFLRKFVIEHLQEVPSLLEMYNNDRAVNNTGVEVVHLENLDLKAN